MDFGSLPPEVNSVLMYSGSGSAPLWAASRAWDTLAADIHATSAGYASALADLTADWQGPAATAMANAFAPHLEWLNRAAAQAEQVAAQAGAAAAAHDAAFSATVPPAVVQANRETLMALLATNVLGQNTPAIAATEAAYGEMWVQDAATMYGYAGQSSAASQLTPFTAPAATTNPGGVIAQEAAVAQAVGTATATDTDSLSWLTSMLPGRLADLAGPLLEGMESPVGLNGSSLEFNGVFGDFLRGLTGNNTLDAGTPMDLFIRGVAPTRLFTTAFRDLDGLAHSLAPVSKTAAEGTAKVAEGVAKAAEGAVKGVGGLGAGISGTIGKASLVGPLSVPQAWSAAVPAAASQAATVQLSSLGGLAGAGDVAHNTMGGMPMAGAGGARGGGGFGAFGTPRYGFRPSVVGRPPAGG